jgi:hypothetical protein
MVRFLAESGDLFSSINVHTARTPKPASCPVVINGNITGHKSALCIPPYDFRMISLTEEAWGKYYFRLWGNCESTSVMGILAPWDKCLAKVSDKWWPP